ncbi:MAG: cupredoxin domain-containing protein [Anaerolineaceae bacterium]|nr:cupredoxin domain-containing protein [Anaerolineaceae bacterium]
MHLKKWKRGVIIAILLLTACSRENTILPGETQHTITLSETTFSPARWRVPAGEKITFQITNHDLFPHDLTILLRPAKLPFSDADEPNIYFQSPIKAGEQTTLEFIAPPAPGEYQVLSTLPGDAEKGLKGTLVAVQLDAQNP